MDEWAERLAVAWDEGLDSGWAFMNGRNVL